MKKQAKLSVSPIVAQALANKAAKEAKAPKAKKAKAPELTPEQFAQLNSICKRFFDEVAGEILGETGGSIKQIEAIELCLAGGSMDSRIPADIGAALQAMSWPQIVALGKRIFTYRSYS